MGYREFADDDGRTWEVWDVQPAPRMPKGSDRALGQGAPVIVPSAAHVSPGWENGWLAFHSEGVSRRLRPIPLGWETTSEENLRRFLASARQVEQKTPS